VVADTQFSDKLTLRSLLLARVPFVGKMRGRVKVFWGGKTYQVREFLDLFPPGKARFYPRYSVFP